MPKDLASMSKSRRKPCTLRNGSQAECFATTEAVHEGPLVMKPHMQVAQAAGSVQGDISQRVIKAAMRFDVDDQAPSTSSAGLPSFETAAATTHPLQEHPCLEEYTGRTMSVRDRQPGDKALQSPTEIESSCP